MRWLDTARAYLKNDPAARSVLDVVLLYPGYHALGFYRLAHLLWRVHLYFIARLISQLGRLMTGIEIHPQAVIGRRCVIDHGMGLVIGATAIVGDDCLLYHGVTLGAKGVGTDRRHPVVGNRVMIGAGAKVLGPITIGDDVRIGANSVVLKDVPSGVRLAGIPATILD